MPPLAATTVSLLELADLAIGTPEAGTVNFTALHTLIVAMLKNLNLTDTPIDFQSTPSPEQSRTVLPQRLSASTPQLASSSTPQLAPSSTPQLVPSGTPQLAPSGTLQLAPSGTLQLAASGTPQPAPAKEKRRSSGTKLELQVKDLGSQVQDLDKQLKTMESQVQSIVTHMHYLAGPEGKLDRRLGDLQEWQDDKEATMLQPWVAGKVMAKHIKEDTEAADQHPVGGRDSRSLKDVHRKAQEGQRKAQDAQQRTQDAQQRTQDTQQRTQDVQQRMQDAQQRMQDAQQRMQDAQQRMQDAQQKAQDAQQKAQDAQRRTQDAQRRTQDAQRRTQDTQQKAQDVQQRMQDTQQRMQDAQQEAQEGQQKGMVLPELTPQEILQRMEELERVVKEQEDFLVRRCPVQGPWSGGERGPRPGPPPPRSGVPAGGRVQLHTPAQAPVRTDKLSLGQRLALQPGQWLRFAPEVSWMKPGAHGDVVRRKLSIMPPAEEATMVTWEELEHAITDGWRASQSSEAVVAHPKRKGQASFPSERDFPGGLTSKRPSADRGAESAHESGSEQAPFETGGRRHSTERVPGQERRGGAPAGVAKPHPHPAAHVRADSDHRRAREHHSGGAHPRRDEREARYGPLQQAFPSPREQPADMYPDQHVGVRFSQSHIYQQPDHLALGLPGPGQGAPHYPLSSLPSVTPAQSQLGMLLPGMEQGWAQADMSPYGRGPPFVPGGEQQAFELPYPEQRGLGPRSPQQPGVGPPGAGQHDGEQHRARGAAGPAGVGQRGQVPMGVDQHGFVTYGVDQHGLVSPLAHPLDRALPGVMQGPTGQQGFVRPSLGISGIMPPGLEPLDAGQARAGQPAGVQPGAGQLGLMQPGVYPSRLAQPDAAQPGVGQPGMGQLGVFQPVVQPGVGQPGVGQPGVGQPGMDRPTMGQLGVFQPVVQPGMGQPGVGQPDMFQPGVGQPGVGQPDMFQPGVGQPGEVQPGVGQPGVGQPDMFQPGVGQPSMGQLGVFQPVVLPGVGQPDVVQPGMGQPGVGQPDMFQPGVGQPSMGQPGVVQFGGMVQPGVGPPGMMQHSVDQLSLGQPGMVQPSMGQPGTVQPSMVQPGMGQPGMVPFGVGQPGMVQPGMGQPDMGQPGMVQPGIGQPGIGQPGVGQPGVGQPGVGQPGVGQPGPGVGQPGVGQPGVGQLGVGQLAIGQPGEVHPGVGQPGVVQLGMGQPGVGQPGVGQPHVGQPSVAQSGVVQPGVAQPGVAQPGVGQPGMGQPGVGQPGVAQPGIGQPGEVQPGVAQPGVAQPGVAQPGVGQPGVGQPGVVQPGVVQPGMAQPGVVQPGVVQPGVGQPGVGQPDLTRAGPHGLMQRGAYQPGLAQPYVGQPGLVRPRMHHLLGKPIMDQQDSVQPGVDESGSAQPGMDQLGLAPPGAGQQGFVQPGVYQHGLVQPDAGQQGLVPPGMYAQGMVQPHAGYPEMVYPDMYQQGFVPPGMFQFGLGSVQPGAGQPGSVQPGAGQPGLVQPGTDGSGLVQPGAGQPGSVQPGAGQPGSVQPGAGQPSSVQPGAGQPGSVQPGAGQPGLLPPGAESHDIVQPGMVPPGAYPPGLVQPGAYPRGFIPPGAYPRGFIPPGAYPRGFIPPGAYPQGMGHPPAFPPGSVQLDTDQPGLFQPGAGSQGFIPPGPESRGFPAFHPDSRSMPQQRGQYGMEPSGRDQYGQVSPLLASQGLAHPGLAQPPLGTRVGSLHPDQQPLASPGPDQPDQVTPGVVDSGDDISPPDFRRSLGIDSFTQLGLDPNQFKVSARRAPSQNASLGYLHRVASEKSDLEVDRHDSLEKLSPNFPLAVETFRLMGELIGLYVELKESMKDLDEEQAGLSDLEKIQFLLAAMVKKTLPPDLQEQLKTLKNLSKDFRQEKAKLEKIERILDSGDLERGKELKPGQLSLQLGVLRVTVSDIEKELAELRESQERGKATMENSVSEASLYLQSQLDKLRTIIENMLASSSTLLSMSIVPQKTLTAHTPGEVSPEATCPACSLDLGHQVSLLVQRYEQLQDMVNNLAASRPSKKAKLQSQDEELLGHVQSAILQVQGDCEKLNITTSNLIEDHRQKQKDIDVLYQGIEKLEKEKANREHLELEIDVKADKSALEAKVSRVQFDATTEQLNHMMQELVAKMSGQEQDWQKMVDKLLLEMDSKLDRLELDPVKQLLEDRWKSLRQQLKERSPLYQADEAAAMRRQLLVHFHCLSCDRPLETPVTGQIIPVTPVGPGLPGHRSSRPYTIFELEQVRQQSRSALKMGSPFLRGDLGQVERSVGRLRTMHSKMLMDIEKVQVHFGGSVKASSQMIRELLQAQCLSSPCYRRVPDMAEYTYSTAPRRCGGSHTLTYPYRRNRLQHLPQGLWPIEEIQIAMKHDEVDILGLDGHIYKGRMATRLPGVLGKDTLGMTKKAKPSRLHPQRQHSVQLLSRPQSAQMLPGSSPAPSSQHKDRPLSSEGRLSQLNTAQQQSSPSETGSLPDDGLHMDVPPAEGLEEPTRGPRAKPLPEQSYK
ncbi:Glutamine-rich protein 2 [Galemys pyrenaicus]|uniref:Glutamine-rich protein 2 n=1 Tax=Galemys pyrenaicus TaxID=202257 RepID=A0A8J6AD97_GALPY|nr:Glutamine-rich protein 2 [Galemys pyrenaicus]